MLTFRLMKIGSKPGTEEDQQLYDVIFDSEDNNTDSGLRNHVDTSHGKKTS